MHGSGMRIGYFSALPVTAATYPPAHLMIGL
jgi:hypothetical protein